jgi:hypothetical protein
MIPSLLSHLADKAEMKKCLLNKIIPSTVRKFWSDRETEVVTVKYFIKTSERSIMLP